MTQSPPSPEPLQYATPMAAPGKGLAIASMVCGICSIPLLVCGGWFLAIPTAIVAIVLGFVARGRASREQADGSGMALAGIIGGSSALVLTVVLIAGLAALLFTATSHRAWMGTPPATTVVVSPANSHPATHPVSPGVTHPVSPGVTHPVSPGGNPPGEPGGADFPTPIVLDE